jgi:hypothetical protein
LWTSNFFRKIQSELLEILKRRKILLKSSIMQNVSSSTHFWHFFKKIPGVFRKTLKQILKYSKPEYSILYLTQQSMFMHNVNSLACTQTDLDKFLTIFEENFKIFQENSWVYNFIFNLAKHVHAKFQLSSLYPDGLRQFFFNFKKKVSFFKKILFSLVVAYFFLLQIFQETGLSTTFKLSFHLICVWVDRHIFDNFLRKFRDFSGKLLSKFKKIPNLSMQFYT